MGHWELKEKPKQNEGNLLLSILCLVSNRSVNYQIKKHITCWTAVTIYPYVGNATTHFSLANIFPNLHTFMLNLRQSEHRSFDQLPSHNWCMSWAVLRQPPPWSPLLLHSGNHLLWTLAFSYLASQTTKIRGGEGMKKEKQPTATFLKDFAKDVTRLKIFPYSFKQANTVDYEY